MRRLTAFCFAATFACAVSCSAPGKDAIVKKDDPKDPITSVSENDSEMNAAIAKARETLPTFFEHWKHPGKGEADFCLKLMVKDGDQVEHFWMADLKGTPGHLTGAIGNEAEVVHNVKLGQVIPIPDTDISDWMYTKDGKIVGNLTLKALFKTMDPEEVKKMKSQFVDP